ncbi:MAG TPA: NAD-dependent epimerase/dehydratase family protein [Gemmatimonadaceae bacterium]|nr:NAD-dependent epimerase/dehydratase family protein [Gemmatimonadaceae bacterium]
MSVAARAAPQTEAELDDLLSSPGTATVEALRRAPGDIVVLGAGGKMGPTLARMAARAAAEIGDGRRVIAVSRYSNKETARALERSGVAVVAADLLDDAAVERLPDAPNVVFMAGQKFGTSDAPSRTWMMNVVVPAYCSSRYASSRIVVFSTGNVYPLTPVPTGGAREDTPPGPVGEYAASCLGRERVFEHAAATHGTCVAIVRLNYAIDLRYGVLTDLAQRILRRDPIPLAMGHVNVIWQGDANRAALELLPHCVAPPVVVNVTGARVLRVRELAEELGRRLGVEPVFEGAEANDALLSETTRMRELLGEPEMPLQLMLDWVAQWVGSGKPLLGKPTHFETRDGAF